MVRRQRSCGVMFVVACSLMAGCLLFLCAVGRDGLLYGNTMRSSVLRNVIKRGGEPDPPSSLMWVNRKKNEKGVRKLQNDDDDDDDLPADVWAYSRYATVVPDPEYHASEAEEENIHEEWGAWHFWDGTEDERPSGDYCAKFAYRDVPDEEFTDEMWQADAVFVNHMLDSGEELVQRSQEAIFVEYGHERHPPVAELLERNKMFRWEKLDLSDPNVKPSPESMERGGWTTQRSMQGLSRRLLHAMMTNDEFVVVVVGGAAAAGDGNHFRQSYR